MREEDFRDCEPLKRRFTRKKVKIFLRLYGDKYVLLVHVSAKVTMPGRGKCEYMIAR